MGHTEMAVSFFEKERLFDDDWLSSGWVYLFFFSLFFLFFLCFLFLLTSLFLLSKLFFSSCFFFLSIFSFFHLFVKFWRRINPSHDRTKKYECLLFLKVACFEGFDHVVDLFETVRHQIVNDHI